MNMVFFLVGSVPRLAEPHVAVQKQFLFAQRRDTTQSNHWPWKQWLMWWVCRQGPSPLSSQGWSVRLDKANISVRNSGFPGSSILELNPISVSYLIHNIKKFTEQLSLSIFIFKIGSLRPPLQSKECLMHSKCFCCESYVFLLIIVSTTQPSDQTLW